jgi:hypothetical protein
MLRVQPPSPSLESLIEGLGSFIKDVVLIGVERVQPKSQTGITNRIPPAREIMEAYQVSDRTARNWVTNARSDGHDY